MNYLNIVLDWVREWALLSAVLIWLTWVFFTAVMRLRELRDVGKLAFKDGPVRCVFAYLALIIGLILDVAVNIIVATPVMFELPPYRGMVRVKIGRFSVPLPDVELLTTARLCRWYHSTDTSWWTAHVRMPFVRFGQQMLDVVDTDGQHIK